jgi:hypothetical protein
MEDALLVSSEHCEVLAAPLALRGPGEQITQVLIGEGKLSFGDKRYMWQEVPIVSLQ